MKSLAVIQQYISFVLLLIEAEKSQQTALSQFRRTPMVHVHNSPQMDKSS